MYINNKWYEECELNAYVKELESTISTLEDKHWNECRQIAHYEDELKEAKRLLKAAMEDMNTLYESSKDEGCLGIKFKWRYEDEAKRLLKETENGK